MTHTKALQAVIDYIEANIQDELNIEMLAAEAGYSVYHFSRFFTRIIGTSVMSYVTWRRLQYALYDLSCGKKVIDVAMDYCF